MGKGEISSYWILEADSALIASIERRSQSFGFDTLRWWQHGCHKMPLFKRGNLVSLSETERVSASTIALPFHLYMQEKEFEVIRFGIANMQG